LKVNRVKDQNLPSVFHFAFNTLSVFGVYKVIVGSLF